MRLGQLKYELLRTPLERPLMQIRETLGFFERRRHPELRELHGEAARIQEALRRILTPRSSCIDVGCHYGSMLSCFCRLAPQGHHLAFEAIPAKMRFLERKFPDVDLREKALCDRSGKVRFHVNKTQSGFSGLCRHGDGEFDEIEVEGTRLDDELPRDRRFDFLKIDVEGAELLVLRGAMKLLHRDHPIILFECGPSGPAAFGYTPGELFDFLTSACHYAIFLVGEYLQGKGPVDRTTFTSALAYPFRAFNWVGTPMP